MRFLLSYLLYLIGDIISRTTMRFGNGYGYKYYNKIMLWSVNLDKDKLIWKDVKRKRRK
jgi:hypothetical protein